MFCKCVTLPLKVSKVFSTTLHYSQWTETSANYSECDIIYSALHKDYTLYIRGAPLHPVYSQRYSVSR